MKVYARDNVWCYTHDHWVLPNPGYTPAGTGDEVLGGRVTIMWLNHAHEVDGINLERTYEAWVD